MPDTTDTVLCEVCCDPVDLHTAHWLHDEDCPNAGQSELRHTCPCQVFAHPECCPECKWEVKS